MNDLDSLRDKAQKSLESVSQALGSDSASVSQPWNPWLISFLVLLIIVFSVLVLHYMRSMIKEGQAAGDVLRLATMPMVIAAAIFLVVLGFSNEQMTPVIGLLGTMIGYILGSTAPRSSVQNQLPATTSQSLGAVPTTPGGLESHSGV